MKIILGLSPVIVCLGGTRRDIYVTCGDLVVVVVESKFSDRLSLYPSYIKFLNIFKTSYYANFILNNLKRFKSLLARTKRMKLF